jgi:hypothetical protein
MSFEGSLYLNLRRLLHAFRIDEVLTKLVDTELSRFSLCANVVSWALIEAHGINLEILRQSWSRRLKEFHISKGFYCRNGHLALKVFALKNCILRQVSLISLGTNQLVGWQLTFKFAFCPGSELMGSLVLHLLLIRFRLPFITSRACLLRFGRNLFDQIADFYSLCTFLVNSSLSCVLAE